MDINRGGNREQTGKSQHWESDVSGEKICKIGESVCENDEWMSELFVCLNCYRAEKGWERDKKSTLCEEYCT